jgi:hypothetical protein
MKPVTIKQEKIELEDDDEGKPFLTFIKLFVASLTYRNQSKKRMTTNSFIVEC